MKRKKKPTRITLAEGVYQDAHGISIVARVGSGPTMLKAPPLRFPLIDSDGIPYSKQNNTELVKARLQLMEDLRRQRVLSGGAVGSLGATIDKWLAEFPELPAGNPADEDYEARRRKRADDHDLIAHWRTTALAGEPLHGLKRSAIRAQIMTWLDAGRAVSTVKHRKRALNDVLRWALGADDDHDMVVPTDGIKLPAGPEPEARGLLMPVLMRILATMPDRGRAAKGETRPAFSETKTRLSVMAWTGLAHKSLRRLERRHVNFRERKIWLPIRKKGAGASGVWVDAMPQAIAALSAYDQLGLWGRKFSESSMRTSWHVALKNTRKALELEAEQTGDRTMVEQFLITVPANCTPYDTRHSFLSDVYRQSGDLKATKELAQHASLKTTERYTKAAVPERVATAIERMRQRWCPETKPAATVRDFQVVGGGKS